MYVDKKKLALVAAEANTHRASKPPERLPNESAEDMIQRKVRAAADAGVLGRRVSTSDMYPLRSRMGMTAGLGQASIPADSVTDSTTCLLLHVA